MIGRPGGPDRQNVAQRGLVSRFDDKLLLQCSDHCKVPVRLQPDSFSRAVDLEPSRYFTHMIKHVGSAG